MARRATARVLLTVLALASGEACRRGESTTPASTYAGTTLRIVVGYRVGGPYDMHARVVANHLGRYLPGEPAVIVENMPGAAGAIAVKHLAERAKADGLTIGLLSETSAADLVGSDLFGRFDALGSPGAPAQIFFFNRGSGVTSVDDWRRASRPPRFASSGSPTPPFVTPLVVAAALGLPIQMVSGYRNSAEQRMAFESGEVDALSFSLDAVHTAFQSAEATAVLRVSTAPVPGFDVPDAISLAADAHARELLDTGVYLMAPLVRFYAVPRGVPQARLALLRDALSRTWTDPRFLAEARAAGLTIDPIAADALERTAALVASRSATVAELGALLKPR
jgi:tripartite-type tricarboxylate transporter receptor subunit TctC